ncbi:hypothetical protein [Massilia orientalis]
MTLMPLFFLAAVWQVPTRSSSTEITNEKDFAMHRAVANEDKFDRGPYMNTKKFFKLAEVEISSGKYRDAINLLRRGISELGDRYRSNGAIDETGTRLALAEIEESNNRLDVAANLLLSVLATRLNMYAEKSRIEGKTDC